MHTPQDTTSGFEALLTGRVLGDRYRIEAVIGRGGMGVVYRALDLRLDRDVAVKVMVASGHDAGTRAELRSRFHREARTIARLHHPNVVAVHDFGTDPTLELDYLVMELLRGEDLAMRLARSGPPPLPLALQILHDAARGLAAGHQSGLIHRDVKPGNIFLETGEGTGEVRVRLLDFGIVQLVGDGDDENTQLHLTRFGHTPHSPAYAAPEQLQGLGCLTPACDVWALGTVAFHLLTGERPFKEADRQRMANRLSSPVPSLRARNPAIPAAVEQVVFRALAFRPEDRFPNAAAFVQALGAVRHTGGPAREVESDHTLFVPPVARPTPQPAPRAVVAASVPREPVRSPPTSPRAAWSRVRTFVRMLVTGSIAAAVLAGWVLLGMAFREGPPWQFYGLLAGMTVAAPLLVHRLVQHPGRYRAGLVFSAILAGVALHRTGAGAWPQGVLLILPAAQMAVAAVMERITRRTPISPAMRSPVQPLTYS